MSNAYLSNKSVVELKIPRLPNKRTIPWAARDSVDLLISGAPKLHLRFRQADASAILSNERN